MTTTTIKDYETTEVTREVTKCDYADCAMTNKSNDFLIIETPTSKNKHYCSTHAFEILDIDNGQRVEGGDKIVVEENPIITMPWDKWTFSEYTEKRTAADSRVSDRNWRQSRHIMWYDVNDTPTIDVPPEVADQVAAATGSSEVVLQVPAGSVNELRTEEVYNAE